MVFISTNIPRKSRSLLISIKKLTEGTGSFLGLPLFGWMLWFNWRLPFVACAVGTMLCLPAIYFATKPLDKTLRATPGEKQPLLSSKAENENGQQANGDTPNAVEKKQ